jgi:ribosomal protein S18 acetylase RimI-like enzyme
MTSEPVRSAARVWRVRAAVPADASALAAFAEAMFRDTFAAGNTPADMDEYCASAFGQALQRAEIAEPALSTLLAEDAGRLVGYVQFGPGEAPACVSPPPAWELRRLYVAPESKGSGLASELTARAVSGARAGGAASLWLGVWERNPRAIRFYEKAGFKVVGEHTFQLGRDPQRDLIMTRPMFDAGAPPTP